MKSLILVLLLISITIFQSCQHSSNPVVPVDNDLTYPLKIGNQWTYNALFEYSNIQPDTIKYMLPNINVNLNVAVTKDTTLNSKKLFELKETSDRYADAYSYYSNEDNGLIKYAYSNNPSLVLPKTVNAKRFLFNGEYFSSVEELIKSQEVSAGFAKTLSDSILFLDPPRIIYAYPITIGEEWNLTNSSLIINKEVVGTETLSTDFGNFECYKIHWKYLNSNGTVDSTINYNEYVNQKGLVRISITFKNVRISTTANPSGVGTADIKYERYLTGVNF